MSGINKTGGLLAVDGLGDITMKKGVFDVHLPKRPPIGRGKAEDDAYRGGFDDGAKSLP